MSTIKIAIVGMGKIARDQHVPSLRANPDFELVAAASPHGKLDGVPNFLDMDALLQAMPEIAAVALCTTPQVRYDLARGALQRGKHVLLEKPPGVTVGEVLSLVDLARRQDVSLFASWHSRHAPAVEPARTWLAGRTLRSVTVTWKEDVRVWHPGQRWIWEAGGLGVFDPGINALSILTHLVPGIVLKDAELSFPRNCATPIAAHLAMSDSQNTKISMDLDFLQTGPQTWDIVVDTDAGRLTLSLGGKVMALNGQPMEVAATPEYAALYAHFADLIRVRRIDADVGPLQIVADAFLCGRHLDVAPFTE
jgi:D-galactose 1-dehydrogenase